MSEALKLISLNIERSKHLDRILPFFQKEAADFVCLQEVMDYDIARIEQVLGACRHFTPVTIHPAEGRPGKFGQAIFSKQPVVATFDRYYWGTPGELTEFDFANPSTAHASETHVVSVCDISAGGTTMRIATTHFTWTPDGEPDDFQRDDLKSLLGVLSEVGEFVLCGDFNAPRGGEIFAGLAEKYKDNIPLEYKTSLDITLHRAAKDRPHELADKMVDGLFTTPGYTASDVRLEFGISDHAAIVATIQKTT